jgi:hypothetical protein
MNIEIATRTMPTSINGIAHRRRRRNWSDEILRSTNFTDAVPSTCFHDQGARAWVFVVPAMRSHSRIGGTSPNEGPSNFAQAIA